MKSRLCVLRFFCYDQIYLYVCHVQDKYLIEYCANELCMGRLLYFIHLPRCQRNDILLDYATIPIPFSHWYLIYTEHLFCFNRPYLSDCDVNCHKKCEKLTANLCGVNQKLIVEALSSVRRGKIFLIAKCTSLHILSSQAIRLICIQNIFRFKIENKYVYCILARLISDNVSLVGSKRDSNYNKMPKLRLACMWNVIKTTRYCLRITWRRRTDEYTGTRQSQGSVSLFCAYTMYTIIHTAHARPHEKLNIHISLLLEYNLFSVGFRLKPHLFFSVLK